MSRGFCTALNFIDVNNLKTITSTRIIRLTIGRTHSSPQCEPANATHAINSYFH
jgi:hypothetical protein